MAAAYDARITVYGNLFALLRSHMRNSGCRVFGYCNFIEMKKAYFNYKVLILKWKSALFTRMLYLLDCYDEYSYLYSRELQHLLLNARH